MDPYSPINGISLERYAELGADVSDFVSDKEKCAEIVAAKGVSRADWDAAVAGWTARMQDMSLMGAVAMRYMPLYQAALAKKGGAVTASYEDFVNMSAAIKAMTFNGMMGVYGVTQGQWTQIAGTWGNTISQNMMQYMNHSNLIEQECQRLRSGGQPKPATSINTGAPAAQQQQQAPQQQAAPQYGAPPAPAGGIGPGAMVTVQWSDGNRYPGAVTQSQQGQCLVAFPDGRQVWVPEQYVALR
ncbi:MAG: hypothetical protein ABI175_11945 [Polyangiales bacterium]